MSIVEENDKKKAEESAPKASSCNSKTGNELEEEVSQDFPETPVRAPEIPPVKPPKPSDIQDPTEPIPVEDPEGKIPPVKEPQIDASASIDTSPQPEFLEIYTDGACSGNPGPGGWAAVMLYGSHKKEISGGEILTTNNKMELKAAIEGLKNVIKENIPIKIYTDSLYVKNGITDWIHNWKLNDFKKVANRELWEELYDISNKFNVEWNWVQSHNGNTYNERADKLARAESMKIKTTSAAA